jgi:hypothetical protein
MLATMMLYYCLLVMKNVVISRVERFSWLGDDFHSWRKRKLSKFCIQLYHGKYSLPIEETIFVDQERYSRIEVCQLCPSVMKTPLISDLILYIV